jgi:hypothetical protein
MANFLPKNKRVQVTIHGYSLNRTNQTQTLRIRFDLTQGDDTLNGLPEWIQNAFTHMIRTGNCAKKQLFDAVFPAATLECFCSGKAKTRDFLVSKKADLSKFEMTRKGIGDDASVVLEFIATFPKQTAIHKYIDETPIDEEVWMQFEQAQTALDLSGEKTAAETSAPEEEEDSKDDDEDEEEGDEVQEVVVHTPEPARTTPLVGLVPRRTVAQRSVSPHN